MSNAIQQANKELWRLGKLNTELEAIDAENEEERQAKEFEIMTRFATSLDNIEELARYASFCDVQTDTIKIYIDRAKAMQDYYERHNEMAKKALIAYHNASGAKGGEYGTLKVQMRKSDRVIIDNERQIPPEFVIVKTMQIPDKTAIKNAIKAGRAVDGAHIEESQSVTIKGV